MFHTYTALKVFAFKGHERICFRTKQTHNWFLWSTWVDPHFLVGFSVFILMLHGVLHRPRGHCINLSHQIIALTLLEYISGTPGMWLVGNQVHWDLKTILNLAIFQTIKWLKWNRTFKTARYRPRPGRKQKTVHMTSPNVLQRSQLSYWRYSEMFLNPYWLNLAFIPQRNQSLQTSCGLC